MKFWKHLLVCSMEKLKYAKEKYIVLKEVDETTSSLFPD